MTLISAPPSDGGHYTGNCPIRQPSVKEVMGPPEPNQIAPLGPQTGCTGERPERGDLGVRLFCSLGRTSEAEQSPYGADLLQLLVTAHDLHFHA